jgi:hypothetical protein
MNKVKKFIFMLLLAASAGITYSIIMLKNIPESFDWDDEDDS